MTTTSTASTTSATPEAAPSGDCCPFCGAPAGAGRQWWTLRSRHSTSEGEVEYCRGGCGCLVVLLDGSVVKTVPARRT
ncbi:hypothetical protein [Streptomyces sp. NPDC054863]